MQLHLDELGMIPATYPKVFYRVSHWRSDFRVADYSTKIEAEKLHTQAKRANVLTIK